MPREKEDYLCISPFFVAYKLGVKGKHSFKNGRFEKRDIPEALSSYCENHKDEIMGVKGFDSYMCSLSKGKGIGYEFLSDINLSLYILSKTYGGLYVPMRTSCFAEERFAQVLYFKREDILGD